jgi:hypothetical protein
MDKKNSALSLTTMVKIVLSSSVIIDIIHCDNLISVTPTFYFLIDGVLCHVSNKTSYVLLWVRCSY